MNYELHYTNLMLKANKRSELNPSWDDNEYTERHHWFPKSIYPEWEREDWNIIKLTAREHYIAHLLLARWLGGKMVKALFLMSGKGKTTSKSFKFAREAFSKSQTGELNHMYGEDPWRNLTTDKRIELANNLSDARKGEGNPMFQKNAEDFMTEQAILDRRVKMSASKSSTGNHMYGIDPWLHQNHSPEAWLMADDVFDWWDSKDKSKHYGHGWKAASKHFNFESTQKLMSVIKWIRSNGDPRDNSSWRNYKGIEG